MKNSDYGWVNPSTPRKEFIAFAKELKKEVDQMPEWKRKLMLVTIPKHFKAQIS